MTARNAEAIAAGSDWPRIERDLDACGWGSLGRLLDPQTCRSLIALFDDDRWFRSRIDMERYGFGRGAYKYFDYPLPETVAGLRTALYRRLAPIANRWRAALGSANDAFPLDHGEFLARCHAAGQTRPTPLLLRYGQGDYNRLHRDLYGAIAFPLQVVILLSEPGRDFDGGELVLTEQSPRRQSRAHVVPLAQGDGVVFAVSERPCAGARGVFRVTMRHGVSAVRSGVRLTLGIIFHDAT